MSKSFTLQEVSHSDSSNPGSSREEFRLPNGLQQCCLTVEEQRAAV